MQIGFVCWNILFSSQRTSRISWVVWAVGVGLLIALLTPLLWTSWRPRWLPWPLESYINGVHNLDQPQPWLFPIFPWTAFAFVGLRTGLLLMSEYVRRCESDFFVLLLRARVPLF